MKYSRLVNLLLYLSIRSATADELLFPPEFKFGVATSAYQIEGGWNEDGKTLSVWDRITHDSAPFIVDQSTGDIACDSYHRWEEDVENLINLGVDYYRFSISWTRILPDGYSTKINQPGVDYYNTLINKLLANGIEPVVTLYHWDMPQKFSILGGFANAVWPDLFADYARTVYSLFGDRVKLWITFNEPNVICHYFNYVLGSYSETYPNGHIEYLCTHNLLKAHAKAYHIYNKEFKLQQKGKVGITLNAEWAEPASDQPEDIDAAERRLQFDMGIFANPIMNFDYPQVVKDRIAERSKLQYFPESRLPLFTLEEKLSIKGTYDFLGLNHYTTWYVENSEELPLDQYGFYSDIKVKRFQDPEWEGTGTNDNGILTFKVVPWGLRKLLVWIKKTYGNPDLLITECGYSDYTGTLQDDRRINFYRGYLNSTLLALHEDGVNIFGFIAWSLMDVFEWASGYTVKLGLYHVDFSDPNRTRTPKQSAGYFKNVIQTRRLE